MPASDAVPVIVGAAVGAGGAVVAQITASVFTARRETARLTWEKERQTREWKMREDERFLNLKQELYTRYSALANQFWMTADSLISYDEKTASPKPEIPDWNEFERLEKSIQLVAPKDVSDVVGDNFSKVLEAIESADNQYKDKSSKTKQRLANIALESWWVVIRAMRADLHGPTDQAPKP